jgi:sulfur-oxidizing protein SoxX
LIARGFLFAAMFLATACALAQAVVPFEAGGGEIRAPLAGATGDPSRGRDIVLNRELSSCVLCHAVPGAPASGNIGPPLAGVGARLNVGQLRLRIVDSTRVNPNTPMPAYYRTDGLTQVAPAWRGKPVFDAQQVEDVVAWLATLRVASK